MVQKRKVMIIGIADRAHSSDAPTMTWGTCRSGWSISSAMCAAVSKQHTATAPGKKPSRKTRPLELHPVLFIISTKTWRAEVLGVARARSQMKMKTVTALMRPRHGPS